MCQGDVGKRSGEASFGSGYRLAPYPEREALDSAAFAHVSSQGTIARPHPDPPLTGRRIRWLHAERFRASLATDKCSTIQSGLVPPPNALPVCHSVPAAESALPRHHQPDGRSLTTRPPRSFRTAVAFRRPRYFASPFSMAYVNLAHGCCPFLSTRASRLQHPSRKCRRAAKPLCHGV